MKSTSKTSASNTPSNGSLGMSDAAIRIILKRFVKDPDEDEKWDAAELEQHCMGVIEEMSDFEKIRFLLDHGYISPTSGPVDGLICKP
jgi:hypothetical protein